MQVPLLSWPLLWLIPLNLLRCYILHSGIPHQVISQPRKYQKWAAKEPSDDSTCLSQFVSQTCRILNKGDCYAKFSYLPLAFVWEERMRHQKENLRSHNEQRLPAMQYLSQPMTKLPEQCAACKYFLNDNLLRWMSSSEALASACGPLCQQASALPFAGPGANVSLSSTPEPLGFNPPQEKCRPIPFCTYSGPSHYVLKSLYAQANVANLVFNKDSSLQRKVFLLSTVDDSFFFSLQRLS